MTGFSPTEAIILELAIKKSRGPMKAFGELHSLNTISGLYNGFLPDV